jgi:hypothetical protein
MPWEPRLFKSCRWQARAPFSAFLQELNNYKANIYQRVICSQKKFTYCPPSTLNSYHSKTSLYHCGFSRFIYLHQMFHLVVECVSHVIHVQVLVEYGWKTVPFVCSNSPNKIVSEYCLGASVEECIS